MKIYHFSRILALPFLLILAFFAVQVLRNSNYEHFAWVLVPIAFLVMIYLFQPQIDYWWAGKHPIPLDEKVLKILINHNPVYKTLPEEEKNKFNRRLGLYIAGKEFLAKGMEQDFDLPHDVKNMIAQIPITMTLNKDEFLLKDLDRIVVYKHAFPSPKFKFLHTVETHVEDGMLVFALDHAEAAFFNPDQYYNVAWHAYAEAFVKLYPAQDYPEMKEEDWETVEKVFGFKKEQILKTLGFESIDLLPAMITAYFIKAENLKEHDKDMYDALDKIFK